MNFTTIRLLLGVLATGPVLSPPATAVGEAADVVIVGGTPAGIMAGIAAARAGRTVILLERTGHIGGLPANGLGATDISTRGAAQGLFAEFVGRVRRHYVQHYGPDSKQVRDCSDGYHFEPSVAEHVFEDMLAEQAGMIEVRRMHQFDALPENVEAGGGTLQAIMVLDRNTGSHKRCTGKVFIDATYEGDLAAAAGAPFRVGRESQREYNEPRAGVLYVHYESRHLGTGPGKGTTGEGDNAVQAYNYRLCLTAAPENRVPIPRPPDYNRAEYESLIEDIRLDRRAAAPGGSVTEEWDGLGRILTLMRIPNGKTDANDQASSFLSTDLAEENWPWPTSSWEWRDRHAVRLRNYTLGLLWFMQNDEEVPAEMRARAAKWGLARDEYADNGHFPRQVYVREGRRIVGECLFTAHDAIPADGVAGRLRPPVHRDSIASSHYHLDSHAARKREPDRIGREGFFSLKGTRPYTIPYGVIVPKQVDQLLVPVAASATHIGLSTLRMEPCWMTLGEAAGTAAALALDFGCAVRRVEVETLQERLVRDGAQLIYFSDAKPGDRHFTALQYFGLLKLGSLDRWEANLDGVVDPATAAQWITEARRLGADVTEIQASTRGELLDELYRRIRRNK
jgi:hypothetical protein